MDGSADEKTSCDGKLIAHVSKFSYNGAALNRGLYFLDLTIVDSNQPSETHKALASAKGKIKAISRFGSILMFELFPEFELPSCSGLSGTAQTTLPPKNESPRLSRMLTLCQPVLGRNIQSQDRDGNRNDFSRLAPAGENDCLSLCASVSLGDRIGEGDSSLPREVNRPGTRVRRYSPVNRQVQS